MPGASRVIYGSPEAAPPPEAPFYLYGDGDDSMRLTVLLAGRLMPGVDTAMREDLALCREPKALVLDRIDALERALLTESRAPRHVLSLVDVDALAVADRERWESDRSGHLARRLYRAILNAAERGGCWLYRPARVGPDGDDLSDLSAESVLVSNTSEDSAAIVNEFVVELRPAVQALLQRGVLSLSALRQIRRELERPDDYVVRVAYDTLSWRAADAIKLLTALRGPQPFNGVLGPLDIRDGAVSAEALPRGVLDEVIASGLVVTSARALRVPGSVRRALLAGRDRMQAPEVLRLHERCARLPLEGAGDADVLEAHHHAVLAGDVERAKSSGRFHGLELRALATQLSARAAEQRDSSGFERAASLFRYVLDHFDPSDAYAWEYLGYNLARAHIPGREADVRRAYERAHELWPGNPLYHGRLLGYRAELGEDVAEVAVGLMFRYANLFAADGDDGLSYFADAVVSGMMRGGRWSQMRRVRSERGALLEERAPRVWERLSRVPPDASGS